VHCHRNPNQFVIRIELNRLSAVRPPAPAIRKYPVRTKVINSFKCNQLDPFVTLRKLAIRLVDELHPYSLLRGEPFWRKKRRCYVRS